MITGCNLFTPEEQQLNNPETELLELIDQWHQDAALANLEAYIGAMSDSAVFIGTDATERWTTSEFYTFCKPHFDAGKTWEFHPVQRFVYISEDGNTAWFDELLDTKLGLCRGSGVLQKYDGSWKIEQYVLSPTIPNDRISGIVADKRIADSVQIEILTERDK
ncbi:MAG: nuclear transport factor 2 family protein [Bacteroidales bacterium]|nr:nuclear transport factor 2 family protein [Bacteroidales bacterium]